MFEVLVLLVSVVTGSIMGYCFSSRENLSKFLLTFSGAFFLATAILEIFPKVYDSSHSQIGWWVLGGLFFQMLIESLSKGAEHGHIHLNLNKSFPFAIFLGLSIHSFFEGLPILHQDNHNLLWAIFIHNIPISMVLFGAILQSKMQKSTGYFLMLVFALSGPLGVIFGDTVLSAYQDQALAFVAGIFIHIATVILFESNDNHKFKAQKVFSVLLGFGIAFLTISLTH